MALVKSDRLPSPPPILGRTAAERLLDHADPDSRREAALALAVCPDAAPRLAERLREELDQRVRTALFTALIALGGGAAVDGLIVLLRSDDAGLRNGAIEALQQMQEEAAPAVEALLEDADPDLRIFAVNIVESLRHPQSRQWLLRVVERDGHVNVAAAAVDLLAELGTPDMAGALEALRGRFPDEPFLHFAIGVALRRIRGSGS